MIGKLGGFMIGKPRFSAMVVLLLASGVVWFYWNKALERQAMKIRSQMRENGYPATLDDIHAREKANADNPWRLYVQAGELIHQFENDLEILSPKNTNETFPEENVHNERWMELARSADGHFATIFELARQAGMQVGFVEGDPLLSITPQKGPSKIAFNLNHPKSLANVLADNAEYQHLMGDSTKALDRHADGFRLAKTVGHRASGPLPLLVSNGISSLMSCSVECIAPTLKKEDLPKTREKIQSLIQMLLDDADSKNGLICSFAGDRAVRLKLVENVYSRSIVGKPMVHAYELLYWNQLKEMTPYLNGGSHWETELARWDFPKPIPYKTRNTVDEEFDLYPQLATNIATSYQRRVAEERLAAISLAWQLHRMDHDGKIPLTLAELVPDYLPHVPMDPFQDNLSPIGYLPDKYATPDGGAKRPVLYYGRKLDLGPNPSWAIYDWEGPRATPMGTARNFREYRDLTAFKPSASPTEGFENEPDEPDEAWDEDQPEDDAP